MASTTYNAVKAMQRCAEEHRQQYPLAYEAVHQLFYVDDFLKSVHTPEKAIAVREQLETALQQGCFPLVKWASNEQSVLLESERTQDKSLNDEASTSVLGLLWDPKGDTLRFKVRALEQAERITKRVVAREGAKIYDPNGYLAPVTIRAKMFIQHLWRTGSGWDDEVSEEVAVAWAHYRTSLSALSEVRMPRWFGRTPDCEVQLHTFCDASTVAYGAVVYARVCYSDGAVQSHITTSKNKLAPVQTLTVPRLELCAAVLGAKLAQKVARILGIKAEHLRYWTDSEIVLYWLLKFPKVFISNRVASIQANSDVRRWAHVASKDNPADLISRGMEPTDLSKSTLWWSGPVFLGKPQAE